MTAELDRWDGEYVEIRLMGSVRSGNVAIRQKYVQEI